MGMALNKSVDGGTTFQQVSVDVEDYTINSVVCDTFHSFKDSQSNTYIYCSKTGTNVNRRIIKISASGVKTVSQSTTGFHSNTKISLCLSRDESRLYFIDNSTSTLAQSKLQYVLISDLASATYTPTEGLTNNTTYADKFAIYKDQYIWVASGTTVKIYNYDTKAELASVNLIGDWQGTTGISCSADNTLYIIGRSSYYGLQIYKLEFNGVNVITKTVYTITNNIYTKQLLLDRFGDLIILTNTGTASTLLKYRNTGTLIDTVNLSVGTNKGAYGLQVYSSDNGTKCWVQFSNDLGTWRTVETTAQGQVFPGNKEDGTTIIKLRDNGVTVYGSDMGGDNNYSVWCP